MPNFAILNKVKAHRSDHGADNFQNSIDYYVPSKNLWKFTNNVLSNPADKPTDRGVKQNLLDEGKAQYRRF